MQCVLLRFDPRIPSCIFPESLQKRSMFRGSGGENYAAVVTIVLAEVPVGGPRVALAEADSAVNECLDRRFLSSPLPTVYAAARS